MEAQTETPKANGKHQPALHFGRVTTAEHKWNHYAAVIPAETPKERMLEPHYWKHYASNLFKPSDIVTCFCEDGSWEASYRVMFVSKAEVRLSLRWEVDHEAYVPEEESETHEIKWGGPQIKFKVVRKDTGEVIKDHLHPKSEAYDFLRRHLQALQR